MPFRLKLARFLERAEGSAGRFPKISWLPAPSLPECEERVPRQAQRRSFD